MDTEVKISETAKREEEILAFWTEHNIFQKSLEKPTPNGEFVFYEGPPTANNHPALHHLESRAFKDLIPRYKTMRGYHVRRKAGWDTHGLPVELAVEKELGLTSKKDIEAYGVEAFNAKCLASVHRYIDEWKEFSDRIGFWVDHDSTYFTFSNDYIESVWNIFQHTHTRGLLYKDYKVVPWCARCGTALSSHEVAEGYKEVTDTSVYVKFPMADAKNEYLLAWTTTPWTLPGNVALAVGKDISYVKVKVGNEFLWVAKEQAEKVFDEYEVMEEMLGSALAGKKYEPLFKYLLDSLPEEEKHKVPKAYTVYEADFVTTEDGTGIVHTAVMYGTDDFELGVAIGLPRHHLVTLEGRFSDDVKDFAGTLVKEADTKIIENLNERDLLLKTEEVTHTYPFCWRCKNPLIYYATDSWYIRMSELRDTLVKENEKINWEPAHIKEGRFGEWLREVKDWAVSRARYWGTPMPVWTDEETDEVVVIGSLDELKEKTKKSGNSYFVMRHGQAYSNANNNLDQGSKENHLTELGTQQVKKSADSLKDKKIDYIISSPVLRAKETAELVADSIGFSKEDIIFDERIAEIKFGELDGKPVEEMREFFGSSYEVMFEKAAKGGETLVQLKRRIGEFLYETEAKYQGKNILFVAHEYPAWMLDAIAQGVDQKGTIAMKMKTLDYYTTGEVRDFSFTPLPHNREYELDFHRPFIDEIEIVGASGKTLVRAPEVLDVWFDAGSMPFAQDHYPFENKERVEGSGYPADFISEAIDQTRGWFYTLHAIGVLMERGHAYKNVISLGHLLDSKGQKMSKSVGNVIDPWVLFSKYGVDALRYWMYTINEPGASKNFDERTVDEIVKKNFTRLLNSYTLYELYADSTEHTDSSDSTHPLDQWIIARTRELHTTVTENLDAYKIDKASRPFADFIDDLSTWYLRRSRDRFKGSDEKDKKAALQTTRWVLRKYAKIIAPFTPFIAEWLWQRVMRQNDVESVHLASWCTVREFDQELLNTMVVARSFVSMALMERSEKGIKVRQPLSTLTILSSEEAPKYWDMVVPLIQDEVNVKQVIFESGNKNEPEVVLDTTITPALQEEGDVRELIRTIQGLRKKAELSPKDTAVFVTPEDTTLLEKHWDEISRVAGLSGFEKGTPINVKK